MKYCLGNRERGLEMEPEHTMDGDPNSNYKSLDSLIQIMQRIWKQEKCQCTFSIRSANNQWKTMQKIVALEKVKK